MRVARGESTAPLRGTGAEQMPVPVDVVDAIDRAPVFVAIQSGRIAGEFPRIRPIPILRDKIKCRMWRVLKRIIALRHASGLDVADFPPDRDHSAAESINLRCGLRFGRLNH